MGTALASALAGAGVSVELAGRGATGELSDGTVANVMLLAVPDAAIAEAAAVILPGPVVGHLSGATGLQPLGDRDAFSLHPLLSVAARGAVTTANPATSTFQGAWAAVAATGPRGSTAASEIAGLLGMQTFTVDDSDRAAYHAAASIASNFLVTLEGVAAELAESAGVPRAALVPLVRQSVENWAAQGAPAALTGPIVRGDDETVRQQRDAISQRMPEQLALFDVMVQETERLAELAERGSQ